MKQFHAGGLTMNSQTDSDQVFDVVLPEPTVTPLERERRAFYRLLPELLKTHRDQYVAIHSEEVIDCGPERLPLVLRAQERVQGGIFVALVSQEPMPVKRSGIRRVLRKW